ncbi:hypothetical protein AVEN_275334-1 [Araneus ventricosus]|uniref:Uncharacterized protein n=1 Tax=Araneus ventricosus TaxID=182803 RepID=A0A4Y2KUV2_ARAVE|nr:hypothetical protein AVEN_275334-1 [Araneus ventricosus]
MWLVPSLSVVLLLRATNCDASANHTSGRAKTFFTDAQELFANEISKSEISGTSSKDISNRTGHTKDLEDEITPNFLPSNFHDFISSDAGFNHGYENLPKELTLSPKRNFYTLFSPRNYHAPKDKLPIAGFSSTSQKPGVHFLSNQYPKLQDRLPPLQLLGFKNANGRTKTEPKTDTRTLQNATSRFARFINVNRQGDDSYWNWVHQDDSYNDRMTPFEMMSLMADRMDPPSKDTGDMISLWKSHLPVMVAAGVIPLSVMLFAVLPVLIKNHLPIKISNPQPTATTTSTATGSRKTINNSTQFLSPILDAIGTFTPRSEDSDCTMKVFCEIAQREKDIWSVKETIQHMTSFIDDSLLDSLGIKSLIKVLDDGDCEKIVCSQSNIKKNTHYSSNKP